MRIEEDPSLWGGHFPDQEEYWFGWKDFVEKPSARKRKPISPRSCSGACGKLFYSRHKKQKFCSNICASKKAENVLK